jgi:hypothetical protein
MKKTASPTGITLPLTSAEIDRIQSIAGRNGGMESWLRSTLLGVLEVDEEEVEFEKEENCWAQEDSFFRPLTPEIIARQLKVMHDRWFDHTDREFDLEDNFESWMLCILIDAIESGGLTLKPSANPA